MKYLAIVFGPLLRRTKTNKFLRAVVMAFCFIVPIGVGLVIGSYKASDQAARWHQHEGVITMVGTEPSNPDYQEYTLSRVNIGPREGKPDLHEVETLWFVKKGEPIDYWRKGEAVTFNRPGYFWRMITWEFYFWGVLAAIIIWYLVRWLEGRIPEFDRQREQKKDLKRAAPANLDEFVALCREHADVTITWEEARRLGACEGGLRRFQEAYFPGRLELTIGELIPLMEGHHSYWDDVVRVVSNRLTGLKILRSSYFYQSYVRAPKVGYMADAK